MKFIVAVLDTMYDWRGITSGAGYRQAPRWFRINPENHTGKRLYDLVKGIGTLIVTDACKELCTKPTDHGKPDPIWLASNIYALNISRRIDVLLVCGRVAQRTWKTAQPEVIGLSARIIEIPHPAARFVWTAMYITEIKDQIKGKGTRS